MNVHWTTLFGHQAQFVPVPIGTHLLDVPGLYCIVRMRYGMLRINPQMPLNWDWIYIGKAESLRDRVPDHYRENNITRHQPTHLLVTHIPLADVRSHFEQDMVSRLNPVENVHYRTDVLRRPGFLSGSR